MVTKAEQIVDENFSGLADLIQDVDLLIFYRELMVTVLNEFGKQCVKELIKEYHDGNVKVAMYGKKYKTLGEIGLEYIKNNLEIKK